MGLPFLKKNTDTLPDISVIQDESTQREISKALEILRSMASIFHDEKKRSHVLDLIRHQGSFLAEVFGEFGPTSHIDAANFNSIFEAIKADIREANDEYELQLERQINRYNTAFKQISNRYYVYPNRIEKNLIEKKLSRSRRSIFQVIEFAYSDKNNFSSNLSVISTKILEYQKLFYTEMADIWKSIQELEKYHNDHSRNLLAKTALFVSVGWILIGQSALAIENIKKLFIYLNIRF